MSVMPTTPAAMRRHMIAEPPAGHGATDMPDDMPMGDMETRHAAMHDRGADHEHPGMASAPPLARKTFIPHEVKLDDAGSIELAFAQLNVVDADGDVTLPGAFPTKDVPMSAYGHTSWDGALPVGKGTISEEGSWAIFRGQFFMDTTAGRETHATIKGLGPLAEYSYGYGVKDKSFGTFEGRHVRFLKALDPYEVSPVLRGAGVATHTLAIKSGAPGPDAPFAEQLPWYSEGLPALLDRIKAHAVARATEGRKLSRADQAALDDLIEAYEKGLAEARIVRASTEPSFDVTAEVLAMEARLLGVPV